MVQSTRATFAKALAADAPVPLAVDWGSMLADGGSANQAAAAAAPVTTISSDTGIGTTSLTTLGTAYTQNFDSLSNTAGSTTNTTLPSGWYITETGNGARDNEQYAVDTGGSSTGDTYSYGAAATTDRALGSLRSGTLIPVFGGQFTNNTGATVSGLEIAYTGEEWRLGTTARTDRLDFQLSYDATSLTTGTWIDVDALDFTTPDTATFGAKNGNGAGDRTALSTTISDLTIANGATFWIRWNDVDASGADDGLAVDDFSLTALGTTAAPGSFAIADSSASEALGAVTFTVSRSGGASGAATLDYAVAASGANPANAADFAGNAFPGGTVSFADGETSKTITVGVANDAVFEPNETFTVTLSNATAGTIGTATATGTITNDDAAPSLSVNDVSLAEGNSGTTAFTFTVTLAGASQANVTVDYQFATNGSADATDLGSVLPGGTLTFAPGETSKTITLAVNGDTSFEGDETFVVNLTNATGGATISDAQGLGTILNDDAAPPAGSLAIDSVTHLEGNSGSTDYTFTVTRSGGTGGAVSAHYDVVNGTTDASDFAGGTLPVGGTVSFADGETSKTITVSVAGDLVNEANETFAVNLSAATGGVTIGTASGTGTITNDDPVPSLSISDAAATEGNAGTTILTYTVTSSGPAPAGGISFDIATADGSATAGSDYVAQSVTGATIAAGQTSYTFSVTVNGDATPETNETVLVNISNANTTIADGQGVGTITNDDGIPPTATIFTENFTGFTAAGFAPTPGAGQLDSDIWRVVGLSDNTNPSYGATLTTGDFARGLINTGDPVTAGVYAPSASNGALILQPTGAELDVNGFIEAKIQNTSGYTASSFDVAFDWAYRNSATRGENMQLSYSTDGVTFTAAPAANFTTPLTPDAAGFVTQHEDVMLSNLFVGNEGYLYLRWTHLSSVGGGSRDEVGIDNVAITGGLISTNVASVGSISVTEGNAGTTAATFTITRSGSNGAGSVDYATSNGTAVAGSDYTATSGTVSFADGETSKTVTVLVNGDTANESSETFFLNLSNAVNLVLPDARGTATITNDDTGPVGIYDIQGLGHVSPFANQMVATSGVVTAVDTNGFYLQDPTGDGNIGTSDAIFVFTGTAPTVAVGNAITLSGTVTEFTATTAGSASLTELNSPTNIVVTNPSVALPAAVLISTDGSGRAPPTAVIDNDGLTSYDPTTDGFDFYESLEGMRVTVQAPRVVAATNSFGETFVIASNGVGDTGLNDRSGNTISAGDNNPETIVITRDAGVYAGYTPGHSQGDTLSDVTGVLTYQFAQYELIVTNPVTTTNDLAPLPRETTNLTGDATHLSYASFNVENLASVPDSSVDARNTQAKVDAAFASHASEIVNALKTPDIIGLQEIQDADGIGAGTDYSGLATANKLIAAIIAAGGPAYQYVEIAPTANNTTGGEPNGNIHNGYLYNPARVDYVEGSAMLLNDAAYNNTRKPLLADFVFNGQTFTAADLHSTSRGGSDPLYAATQPPVQAGDAARTAQATALSTYINGVLGSDPSHKFIVNGDFNGYYYEDGLKALQSNFGGTGALTNLYEKLSVEERYSYYFGGYYQAFDNILVTGGLATTAQFDVVHYNAGYTDGLSATDHDQPVALIELARTGGIAVAVADSIATSEAAALRASVLANDTGGDSTTMVTAVNGAGTVGSELRLGSGALLTVNANGTYVYNPDGAFSALASGQTATDSFTYTLSGGSTATVTVTINGLTNTAPGAGNDTEGGTAASDVFDFSAGGNDTASGGAGADTFAFGAAFTAADRIDGGSGNDQIGLQGDYTGANALVLGANTIAGVETIALLGSFSYDLTTNDANVAAGQTLSIYGSELGAGNNLTFNGAAETDGRIAVYGGLGTDTITTGAGNDGIYFGRDGRFNPATDHVDGGAGTDQLALDGSYTVAISGQQIVHIETLALLDGSATPANYNVTLLDDWAGVGETRTIYFAGLRVGATVDGSAETSANFIFYGGNGDDVIKGGAGNDIINGGPGADTLTGGAGVDTFSYTSVSNSIGTSHDIIVGFDANVDKIDLPFAVTGIDANVTGTATAATLDADLTTALAGLGANHAVQFTVTDGGALNGHVFEVIDANGAAGYQAGQDMVIELQGTVNQITTPTPFV